MDTPESNVHSFIVKVWLEEAGDETKTASWHGYITHVPSGERRYLRDLGDILSFIKPYFKGIEAHTRQSLCNQSWLRPWRRRKR